MSFENPIKTILTSEDKPPEWLIPELFLQGALVCLAGEPGAGKSYISYTIGLAIGSGEPAFSGIVPAGEPRRVVYFDQENSEQDRDKYLKRSWYGLEYSNGKLPDLDALQENFVPVHFHLGDDDWQDRAREHIEFWRPHAIIFDTATPCFNIQDENDNAEATRAIKGIRELQAVCTPKCTAIVLKHSKIRTEKGGKRTMRGAKAWHGAVDGVMFQVKAPGRPKGKDNLKLTRLVPDKTRAYGLSQTIYITPKYTDTLKSGLALAGDYEPGRDHIKAERDDEGDDDESQDRSI